MAAGSTYTPIATTTRATTGTTIDFTSISSAYTDLVLVFAWKAATADQPSLIINLNADYSTLYSFTHVAGNGTIPSSRRASNQDYIAMPRDVGQPNTVGGVSTTIIQFNNYANTTNHKTIIGRGSAAETGTELDVALYRSNSAINQITITAGTNQFAAGTMATLYGILAA
jgi:hypothetical protein